jgi:hypothetical protein
MKLAWKLHPKHINVHVTTSAAYQYRLQEWNDGRAELTVQHLGERPSGKPVKRFVYRNRNGAFGGAQRFEDQHGYRDPAHHAPAAIAALLPELPEEIEDVIHEAQVQARVTRSAALTGDGCSTEDAEEINEQYLALCAAVLCCVVDDCYNRTEIGAQRCADCANTED